MEFQPEVLEKLKLYQNQLVKWQEKINLVSPNTIKSAWERHFLDSAQVASLLPENKKILFDLGCGAGFPGLVLAAMKPDLTVHLVESDQKKCSFMKSVSRETGISAHIENTRIEHFEIDIVPDIITARALAELSKLFDYCERWIAASPALTLIFLKGQGVDEELKRLEKGWEFRCEMIPSMTEAQAKILKFTNVRKR